MHAVLVKVKVGDFEKGRQGLENEVVPRAAQAPGFVAGYWTRPADGTGNEGLSLAVFESEDAARTAAERVRSATPPETVTIESVEVREVVAHA
jgi:hypothetical protein